MLKDERVERPKNWPFYPELLGFVSYEQDPACFAAYDEVLLFDHRTKLLRVVQFEQTDGQYWLTESEEIEVDSEIEFDGQNGIGAIFIDQTRQEYIASIKNYKII